jgi:hypothetical protein
VFLFDVRVTNRQEVQRLNLSFGIGVEWNPRPELRPVVGEFSRCRTVAKRKYEDHVLPEVVDVGPGRTVSGYLKMSDHTARGLIVCEDSAFAPKEAGAFYAVISDHVSGQETKISVPGKWSS